MVCRGNGGEDVEGAVVQERRCNDDELGREAMQDHCGRLLCAGPPLRVRPYQEPTRMHAVKEIGCGAPPVSRRSRVPYVLSLPA